MATKQHRALQLTDVRPWTYTAALVAASLLALTSCTSSGIESTDSAQPPTDAPPTPSPPVADTPEAAAEKAVLAAYQRFWDEQAKAYAKGSTQGTDFDRYAAAVALASTKDDLAALRSKGIVTKGAPDHETTVEVIESGKVPSAKLSDCLDSTDWTFIYSKTGKRVDMPEERLLRYVTKVEAEKWGKQWKIVKVTPQQKAC